MNKKVVVFGGGKGLSYLLRGLKDFPIDITAVITVSDDGRSTGRLRKEFNVPGVGDIRKSLSNLSTCGNEISKMLEYRFNTKSDLGGHALGNLMLISLLNITGSLKKAVEVLSTLLNIKAKVLPLTEDLNVTLMAETEDCSIIEGQVNITKNEKKIKRLFYKEQPKILPEIKEEIKKADLIIFSMGSLYTSIFPHLISTEVIESLDQTKAPIIYLCNIVTQPGETANFAVSDHVKLINNYLGKHKLEAVIASNSNIDEKLAQKYADEERKDPVKIDYKVLKELDVELIEADLLTICDNTLKHHSGKLSSLIFSYLMR